MWDHLRPFCLLHNHHSIPPIVLYPWLTLMYCVKVEKVWDYLSMKQLLGLSSGYRSWEHLCVTKMKHSLTIWFCRDELSFAMLFWEDMITLISMLEVLLFLLSIWTFILNHLDLNIHATIKRNTLRNMLGSIPHHKFLFLSFTYSRTSRN